MMGGQIRNKRRFKLNKSHVKGHRVNYPKTFSNKRKPVIVFRSIIDINNKLDKLELNGASMAKPPPLKVKNTMKPDKKSKWSDIILFEDMNNNDVIWRINPKLLEEFDNDYDNIRERGFID